jgi:hypothetical protein
MKKIIVLIMLICLATIGYAQCFIQYSYPSCGTWCESDTVSDFNMCLGNCKIVNKICGVTNGKDYLLNQSIEKSEFYVSGYKKGLEVGYNSGISYGEKDIFRIFYLHNQYKDCVGGMPVPYFESGKNYTLTESLRLKCPGVYDFRGATMISRINSSYSVVIRLENSLGVDIRNSVFVLGDSMGIQATRVKNISISNNTFSIGNTTGLK